MRRRHFAYGLGGNSTLAFATCFIFLFLSLVSSSILNGHSSANTNNIKNILWRTSKIELKHLGFGWSSSANYIASVRSFFSCCSAPKRILQIGVLILNWKIASNRPILLCHLQISCILCRILNVHLIVPQRKNWVNACVYRLNYSIAK